jgi:hypothetical protein
MRTCILGFNLFSPCSYGAQLGAGGGELSNQAVGAIEGTVVGCKFSANSSESRFVSAVCDLQRGIPGLESAKSQAWAEATTTTPKEGSPPKWFFFFVFFFPQFCGVKSFEIFFFLSLFVNLHQKERDFPEEL